MARSERATAATRREWWRGDVPLDAFGLDPTTPLARALRRSLAGVERLLGATVADAPSLVDRARPPFAVEGVRLHAALALLGGAGPTATAGPVGVAASVVELTHLAGRLHWSLDAPGRWPAAPAERRNRRNRAVLAGDLLLIRATGLAAGLPVPALRRWTAALGAVHEALLAGRVETAMRTMHKASFAVGLLAAGGGEPAADALAARWAVEAWLDGQASGLTTSAAPTAPAAR